MRRLTLFALLATLVFAVACTTSASPGASSPRVTETSEGRAQEAGGEETGEEGRVGSTEVEEEAHETQESTGETEPDRSTYGWPWRRAGSAPPDPSPTTRPRDGPASSS